MKRTVDNDAKMLHKLMVRIVPEKPSEAFTMHIMEKISPVPDMDQARIARHTWIFILGSALIIVAMIFFPIWKWIGVEFTPWEFLSFYATQYLHLGAQWFGKNLSYLANMGYLSYLIPVSVAIILLSAFDQAMLHKRMQSSTT